MSIATKRGDEGMTDLMFGRRVSKSDPRVEVCGTIDELNAALGLARVWAETKLVWDEIAKIQGDLVLLMGEVATLEEDLPRYVEKGKAVVTDGMVTRLDDVVRTLEEVYGIHSSHWARPGEAGSRGGAYLDLARTVGRRGERAAVGLVEGQMLTNREVIRYLNRLSDVIWLLARLEEHGENR